MAKKRSKAVDAKDFLEYLNNNPEYQARMREKEKQMAERRRILDEDQASLVQELQKANIRVRMNAIPGQSYEGPIQNVWDLVNSELSYAAAIPILVEHLEKNHHPAIQEGIVRALSIPEAWGVAPAEPLIRLFREEADPDSQNKWLLGAAIAHTATLADAMTICDLMEDERHGRGREYLPLALIHCPKDAARAILEPLVGHPVMGKNASKALSIIRKNRIQL